MSTSHHRLIVDSRVYHLNIEIVKRSSGCVHRCHRLAIRSVGKHPVRAADGGTVAAITTDSKGVPIIVIRHSPKVLTVYANVDQIEVNKGDSVARGQTIAALREEDTPYVHFEVRNGFDSVDPGPYLR